MWHATIEVNLELNYFIFLVVCKLIATNGKHVDGKHDKSKHT